MRRLQTTTVTLDYKYDLHDRRLERVISGGDGHLYFQYEDGVMALVAATPDKYQLKGQFQAPGNRGSLAHPAISNSRLYLRAQDALYCYDLRKK